MFDENRQMEIYKQRCKDFRSLNEIMWRVPVMLMTITGGLWFAIAKFEMSNLSRIALLIFAAVVNLLFTIVLYRLRGIMEGILVMIHDYEKIEHKKGFQTVRCFIIGMILIAASSAVAAFNIDKVFIAKVGTANVVVGNIDGVVNIRTSPDGVSVTTDNVSVNVKAK